MAHRPRKTYWHNVNPAGAVADLVAVFRQAGRHRWRFAAAAALASYLVLSLLIHEETLIPPRPPKIIYITAWHAGRSDAEIRAGNIANQRRKEALAAEQARRDEEVRNIYKTIGRASGMDVDAIERQAKADQAAEARRKAASEAALIGAAPRK